MPTDLIRKFAKPVPRYTSYPTAPQFSPKIDSATYASWIKALAPDADLSLYVHIPFCDQLCWYCGCNTKATQRYKPVADYVRSLVNEVSFVTSHTMPGQTVRHVHWGGGSPNILEPQDILRVNDALRAYFNFAPDAEFAIEIDPRRLSAEQTAAFARSGVTRVSVGVQDFDTDVQAAINRVQSYETTLSAVTAFRRHGITSINVDLVYGLPHQTVDSVLRTMDQVISIGPDRIALFGYAHLPSRISHQRLINEADLPDAMTRFEQSQRLAEKLIHAGYVRVGLDHFALPDDPLASRPVRRNFQGYTSDDCNALLGLGASAIGQLPQGYVQNATATHDYMRRVREQGLACVKGHALTDDDRMRAYVINQLMCDLSFEADDVRRQFGDRARPLIETARFLMDSDDHGLIERRGDGFVLTGKGRPFVRTIAACFDAYLNAGKALHSLGV